MGTRTAGGVIAGRTSARARTESCCRTDIDEDEWGIRDFTGEAVDGFAWKTGLIPGRLPGQGPWPSDSDGL